jgi:hypothetical protein
MNGETVYVCSKQIIWLTNSLVRETEEWYWNENSPLWKSCDHALRTLKGAQKNIDNLS